MKYRATVAAIRTARMINNTICNLLTFVPPHLRVILSVFQKQFAIILTLFEKLGNNQNCPLLMETLEPFEGNRAELNIGQTHLFNKA